MNCTIVHISRLQCLQDFFVFEFRIGTLAVAMILSDDVSFFSYAFSLFCHHCQYTGLTDNKRILPSILRTETPFPWSTAMFPCQAISFHCHLGVSLLLNQWNRSNRSPFLTELTHTKPQASHLLAHLGFLCTIYTKC